MKQRIILFGLILVGTVTFAQSPEEKGLNTINRSSAEATIGFLASDELQGREAGFHGSYVSSEYIASILQWMGIQPLNESYFQPFDAYRRASEERTSGSSSGLCSEAETGSSSKTIYEERTGYDSR